NSPPRGRRRRRKKIRTAPERGRHFAELKTRRSRRVFVCRDSGGSLEWLAAVRRWNGCAVGGIFVELVAQRADRDAEDISRVRAIAEAVLERLQNQIALDLGHGAADQVTGDLLGGNRSMGGDIGAAHLVEPRAVRRKNSVDTDFLATRKQHGAMQRVLELADIARPAIAAECTARLRRQRPQGHAVGLRIFAYEV